MAKIEIDVLAKAQQAQAQIRGLTGDLGGMRKATSSAGDVFKGVLGSTIVTKGIALAGDAVGKLTDEFDKAKQAASDLQQSSGAVDAIFGKNAAAIQKQAAKADQALGLTRNSYQELASTLGAGLKNQGLKDYAGQTQKVIGLGADLSAQFGGPTKDAVEAIASLMRGEADPIERYGVSIKQSAINAELAAKGQDKLTGAARTQAEAQARLGLLFKQTSSAQGTFAKESDTYAGQEQRNAARIENARAKIGTALLPVLTQLQTGFANNVLPVIEQAATWIGENLPGAIRAAQAAIGPWIEAWKPIIAGVVDPLRSMFSGEGIDTSGLLSLLESVKAGLVTYGQTVGPIIGQVIGTVGSAIQEVLPLLQGAAAEIGPIMTNIASIITSVWKGIGPIILPTLKAVMIAVGGILKGAVQIISGVLKIVSSLLKGDWRGAWEGAKKVVAGVVQVVKSLVGGLVGVLKAQWGGLLSSTLGKFGQIRAGISSAVSGAKATAAAGFASLVSSVTSRLAAAVSAVRAVPGRVKGALAGVGGLLVSAGYNLIQGFISGISGSIGAVIGKAREIASAAVNAAKSALGIQSPSRVFMELGKYVAQGFAKGITGNQSSVTAALKTMATKATANFKQIYDADKKGDLAAAREKLARAKKGWAEQQKAVQTYGKARAKIAQLERGGVTRTERAQIKSLKKQAKAAAKILKQTDKRAAAVRKAEDRVKDVQSRDTGAQALRATDKLMARYRKQLAAVQANAKARDALAARITNEKKKLADLIKVRNDYSAAVRDNARAFADSTKVELGENENLDAGKIAQSLRDRLNAIQNFNLKLERLKKLGIDQTTYNQIVQAGVEGGMATADALIAGGPAAVKEIAGIQKQIGSATTTLGNATADTMYKAGIQAQQGLIAGLTKDLSKLDAASKKMADQLTKAFKKALGIKSPSRVFKGLGQFVTDGLEIGLDDQKIAMAGRILAGDLVDGFAKPVLRADAVVPAGMGAGAAGGRTYNLTFEVPPSADKVALGREVMGLIKAFERAGGKL